MSRRAALKVVKAKYTPSAPWMVRVPPRLQRVEGAQKKFFAKESIRVGKNSCCFHLAIPLGLTIGSCVFDWRVGNSMWTLLPYITLDA